jgi:hypothetical protein
MYDEPTTALAAQEQASHSRAALQALGNRLEDRGHDDSLELTVALVAAAVVDAIRELTYKLSHQARWPDGRK